MNSIKIKISGSPLKISLPDKNVIIGSQFDNFAKKFAFERPPEHENNSLILLFENESTRFVRVNIGKKNGFAISNYLTQSTTLKMQAAFERDETIIAHSDVIVFHLRQSILPGENEIGPPPESALRLIDRAIVEITYESSLLSFKNFAGQTIGLLTISGYSPYIAENGNWFEWCGETLSFVDTGRRAKGEPGPQGERGLQGEIGLRGEPGPPGESATLFVVNSGTEMLALPAQVNNTAIRRDITDESNQFILTALPPTDLRNWETVPMPVLGVASVNGKAGNVILNAANISDPETGRSVSERLLENDVTRLLANRLYPGRDLRVLFAGEIAAFGGDPWMWIRSRIRAGDYNGINVCDFIPFIAGGNTIFAEVAGINTYTGYGDRVVGGFSPVENHIDFISRDCWPEIAWWNLANYNNGLNAMPNPWLASNLYTWLNSLKADVPNGTGADPATTAIDYRDGGVYSQLPQALRDVIVQKRILLPRRYVAGSLLANDNGRDWRDIGPLWIPSEIEVFGFNVWGSAGHSVSGFRPYPIFGQSGKLAKNTGINDTRASWWILATSADSSANVTRINATGIPDTTSARGDSRAPVCFRIA